MAFIRSFRDLDVYRAAREQSKAIFHLTKRFPREEMYSLTDQIRRSSRAVNAMISEAWARRQYPAVFVSKLSEALGEATETQAWLDHALDCNYISRGVWLQADRSWQQIGGMLYNMMQKSDNFCREAKLRKS